MNKKIKQYSALAIAAAAALPLSCKKDDKNDPNIEDKTLNKVITASGVDFFSEDSIDINSDGVFDFNFSIGGELYDGNTYAYGYINGTRAGNALLTTEQTFLGYTMEVLTAKNSGDAINSTSTDWTEESYIGYKYNSDQIGHANGSDKIFGFRFKIGSDTHYGWVKTNLASDYKTLTIKEIAYNKTANAEIKAGEK